jgi:nitroimidazol reductase NimA-like FMN-containing flavoprotein (pyridoxamine 5'-phosphate oxidase superfamily)
MAKEPPRSTRQRVDDTVARLEHDVDAWVATADQEGNAYLVPLTFLWDARTETKEYAYFRITPQSVRAWREENELKGRTLMRDGAWLAEPASRR